MVAEEKKASATLKDLGAMVNEGLAARRTNGGPYFGGHAGIVAGGANMHPLAEYRRVEDVVLAMSGGKHRDELLDTLRGIHEEILHNMTGGAE